MFSRIGHEVCNLVTLLQIAVLLDFSLLLSYIIHTISYLGFSSRVIAVGSRCYFLKRVISHTPMKHKEVT